MKSVLCNGCHKWFDAKKDRCDRCGLLRPSTNVALGSQRWASMLNERKRQALSE
jgi:predicted amidophosphoribosyltransferase